MNWALKNKIIHDYYTLNLEDRYNLPREMRMIKLSVNLANILASY